VIAGTPHAARCSERTAGRVLRFGRRGRRGGDAKEMGEKGIKHNEEDSPESLRMEYRGSASWASAPAPALLHTRRSPSPFPTRRHRP
jgi:hypothetical protein